MKTLILILLTLSISIGGFSQFTRSFLQVHDHVKEHQTIVSEENATQLNLTIIDSVDASFINFRSLILTKKGAVVAEQFHTSFLQNGGNYNYQLAGVFKETIGSKTFIVHVSNGSNQKIIYLQIDTQTGQTVNVVETNFSYQLGYMEHRQYGNELVTYLYKSSVGFVRISKQVGVFTGIQEEVVSTNPFTPFTSFQHNSSRKLGEHVLSQNKEIVVFSGIGQLNQLAIRNANSSYQLSTLPVISNGFANLIGDELGNVFVSEANTCFSYDANMNLMNMTTFSVPLSTTNPAELICHSGQLKVISKNVIGSTILKLNQQLQELSIDTINVEFIPEHQIQVDGLPVLCGLGNYITVDYDVQGNLTTNPLFPMIQSLDNQLDLKEPEEYLHQWKYNELEIHSGLANQSITEKFFSHGTAGLKFEGQHSLIYNLNNKFVGEDNNGVLYGSGSSSYTIDMLAGPYTEVLYYTPVVESYYNRGFHVTTQEIENHIFNIQNGNLGYEMPRGIADWPAHGTTSWGQVETLAPYVDVNGNSIYEPELGDYPKIRGNDCFFSITHQNPSVPNASGIEVHTYVYSFNCDTNEQYSTAFFITNYYFARTISYEAFHLGSAVDFDLGKSTDDFVGTHVPLGLIYAYNGDENDESGSGISGFETNLPVEGVMVLKGAKLDDDGLDNLNMNVASIPQNGFGFNDGVIDNECATLINSTYFTASAAQSQSDPTNLMQNYNYLMGNWAFGDPLYYGGTGSQNSGNTTTIQSRFAFPNDSDSIHFGTNGIDPNFAWSEIDPQGNGSASNASGDRRMIGATLSQPLNLQDTLELTLAYVFAYDSSNVSPTSTSNLAYLFELCSAIKNDFNANSGPCNTPFSSNETSALTEELGEGLISLFPNPAASSFTLTGWKNTANVAVYDANGKMMVEKRQVEAPITLSLDEWAGSVFIVKVFDGNSVYQHKLIKY